MFVICRSCIRAPQRLPFRSVGIRARTFVDLTEYEQPRRWRRKTYKQVRVAITAASAAGVMYSIYRLMKRPPEPLTETEKEFQELLQPQLAAMPLHKLLIRICVLTTCQSPLLISLASNLISVLDALDLSVLYIPPVRATFYEQFCGGFNEFSLTDKLMVLRAAHIKPFLSYSKEYSSRKLSRAQFAVEAKANATAIALDIERVAVKFPGSCIAIKPTAIVYPDALQRLTDAFYRAVAKGENIRDILGLLSPADRLEIANGLGLALLLAKYAHKAKAKLVIDAEQRKYQAGVHLFAVLLSENVAAHELITDEPLVYTTHQMYLKDALSLLSLHLHKQFRLGVKLVRGAYLDSEDPRVLCESYKRTNEQYNTAIKLCSDCNVHTIVATHNHDSVKLAMSLNNPRISYAQLLGMADDISYYLAHHGQVVYKYIPYGRVPDVIPYLIRRAHENKSMIERTTVERNRYLDELIRRVKVCVYPPKLDCP